jgi:nonribosomal peptide synthetase protein BlmIII
MDTLNPTGSVLLAPDQQALWDRLNDTAADIPATTVWTLVAERAAADPGQAAVIAARRTLTYGQLAAQAAALAARLATAGPGATVAICVEPGWEQVVAAIGALRAGLPFFAIDPHLSQAARWRSITDLGAATVLTQSWLDERLAWPAGTERVAVDALPADPEPVTALLPGGTAEPDTVACLVPGDMTSARLLPVTNGALADTITDLAQRFGLGPADRVLAVSALGDDVSVYATLGILAVGGGIVIPDDIDLNEPPAWVTLMQREHVTVWHSPPTQAALLAEHLRIRGEGVPEALRVMLLGGEPLAPALAAQLRRQLGPDVRMANLGGAVPGGLWVSCLEIGEPEPRRGHVPIGAPLANKHLYVLTEAMTLCPVWVTGRVFVGGRGLPGSLREPGDGAQLPATGEHLFRTDLTGRLLPDGTVDIVSDDAAQITVNGHPLNLRDVESALAAHDAVTAVAVVPAGEGSVAYVKPAAGSSVTGPELLGYLRTKMSPYLLPEHVELVFSFRLTPGGRIDRAALGAISAAAAASAPEQAAPSADVHGELAERACALTAQILGVSEVEPTMNLLDLGATSVQLVRLAVQAEQELGISVDVEELLRFPSVAVLLSSAAPVGQPPAADQGRDEVADEAGREAPERPDASGAPAELILDPVDRNAFKDSRPAIRRDLDTAPAIDLVRPPSVRERLGRRSTHRAFSPEPVARASLGALLRVLGSLGPARTDGTSTDPKYAYPSAGSLYPVQVYLTAAAGRVEGIAAGVYYYHPTRHRLLAVTPDAAVEASAHAWINREAFRSSAFTVYLVACLDAIEPMYGIRSRDYSLIEAGAMCQLLMTEAAELGLGLCPVGEMDFAAIRGAFRLPERTELLHALIGGVPSAEPPDPAAGAAESGMLRRVGLVGEQGAARTGDPR